MDALQYARYKQPTGAISLAWIIHFSSDAEPDTPRSTSSQPDYLPSPMPSPEPSRKHSGKTPRTYLIGGIDSARVFSS